MPLSRPNVVVSQEYEQLSVVPASATLSCLIVGPCRQLLDYLDDKDDCAAGTYGTLNGNSPRSPSTTPSVAIATPPNLSPGAILDDESVRIFFDNARVELVDSGVLHALYYQGDNLFTTTDEIGVHMGLSHVEAGDILLTQSTGTDNFIKTVKELAYTFYGATLDFTAWGVIAGDIITVSADESGTSRDGTYVVKGKYIVNGSVVDTHIELEDADNLVGGPAADAHITITAANGTLRHTTVGGAKVSLGDWCNLRITEDFTADNPVDCKWRVERALNNVELSSADFTVNSTTKAVTLNAGIDVIIDTVVGAKPVTYAQIYMEYSALRTDLQNVNEISSSSEAIALLGKYDARNPLCVGVHVALANTSTVIKVYGLGADTLAGYTDFTERTGHLTDIYAVVALTYSTSILGYLKSVWENYADPTYVLNSGIKQKFRTVIGAVELVTQKDVVTETAGATSATKVGTAPAGNKTLTFTSATGQTEPDFAADGVLPGDLVTYTIAGVSYGPYTVAQVRSATVLETEEVLVGSDASSVNGDEFAITDPDGVDRFVPLVHDATPKSFVLAAPAVLDDLYLVLNSSTSSFISDGVVPGDLLQIPSDPETDVWTTYSTWVVALVDSQTRLTIVNSGNNTSGLENELPHGVKRVAAADRLVSAGSIYFRVKRNMSKTEQVNEMLAVAQSLNSKRSLICYPDSVDVTDLVDGSKTRVGSAPAAADAQPGYYLACMVGGQTAGQPSQQGFTNLGGNGIDRIYNSNDYFSEEQLTNLSNGGVYVFVQDAPNALPYTIHSVTTDVLSLETGEYMHVKNLDRLSTSFLLTLRPFIGVWNITTEAIQFVTQALYANINLHKSEYLPKIGSPLIDAKVRTVFQNSDISEDRLEAYVDADTPTVLNTIALHLVA